MEPFVLRRHDTIQLSYDVPHHIFSSKVYPCRATNGSTIILYGHEEGIRILWRGGHAFKTSGPIEEKSKVNGVSANNMVIDLDNDEPEPAKSAPQPPEFEDEDGEIDVSAPYQHVLRSIDITIGTACRHLVVPHIPPHASEAAPGAYPPIYSSHIVVAVACDDLSVRLVVLPLTPPAPASIDPSGWGVQIVKVGSNPHQDSISSIAITHTSPAALSDDDVGKSNSRSRSRNRLVDTDPAATFSKGSPSWCFLIASTSPTAGGLLAVHQIPLTTDTSLSTSPETHALLERQYIRSPLPSTNIYFNPSPYPAERHSNILITCPDSGSVKIYQALPETATAFTRGRRGSAATTGSATSSSRSLRASSNRHGKFLITLHPGFVNPTESDPCTRRKHVLDASWVLGGRAILVLLEGGEWGVWDIEGAGPGTSGAQSLFRGQDNVSGIQGGALTKFSLRGFISTPAEEVPKTQKADMGDVKTGKLAPMTPHTRKMRSEGLFRGSSGSNSGTSHHVFTHGTICVTEHLPTKPSTNSTATNESVLLSYGNSNLVIPSLLSLWRAETSGKGSLDTSGILRPFPFTALQLGGQQQSAIAALLQTTNATSNGLFGLGSGRMPDVLITTEHRLIMLVSPISEPTPSPSKSPASQIPAVIDADQLLLTHGDLDIDGMDRILDDMTKGSGRAATNFGKSVGFDLDDDGDIRVMGTPTPKNKGRPARARAMPAALRSSRKGPTLFT